MNIAKLFSRGGKVEQAIGKRSEAELSARLAEIQAGITSGTGDVLALLEEREAVKREIQAAAIVREKRDNAEYRARINKEREKYLAEVQAEVAELWKVLPRARWVLFSLSRLEENAVGGLDGKNFDEISGLRLGSARRMGEALIQELRGTTLLQEYGGPGATESEPKVRTPGEDVVSVRMPRFLQVDIHGNRIAGNKYI